MRDSISIKKGMSPLPLTEQTAYRFSKYAPLSKAPLCSLAACLEEIFQRRNVRPQTVIADVAEMLTEIADFQETGQKSERTSCINLFFKKNDLALRALSLSLLDVFALGEFVGEKGNFLIPFLEASIKRDNDIVIRYCKNDGSIHYGLVESVDSTHNSNIRDNKTIRILEIRPKKPSQHLVFSKTKLKKALSCPETGFIVIGKDTFSL